MLVEQLLRHQDEAGRAKAALEGAGLDEGLLHRIELVRRRRGASTVVTSAPSTKDREVEAAGHRLAVHQHGAAAAQALPAALARAEQIEFASAALDEVVVRRDLGRDRPAVEGEADGASPCISFVPERLVGLGAQRAEHRLRR